MFIANCYELPQIVTYAGFADPIFAYNNVPKKKFPNDRRIIILLEKFATIVLQESIILTKSLIDLLFDFNKALRIRVI